MPEDSNSNTNDFEPNRKKTIRNNADDKNGKNMMTSQSIFRYFEVASRCRGRLDVRHRTSSPPFTDPNIISNPILFPMVQELLGHDAKLLYTGLIFSFPDSSDQPWHMDGTTLFPELSKKNNDNDNSNGGTIDLPAYALNIFIPLENDITEDIGPTEFFPGSHLSSKTLEIDDELIELHARKATTKSNIHNNSSKMSGITSPANIQDNAILKLEEEVMNRHHVVAPLLKKGDALIYDYRVCHRGTANLSREGNTRIMLYLMYARPWFREHLNFGTERLFPNHKSHDK